MTRLLAAALAGIFAAWKLYQLARYVLEPDILPIRKVK